jgi:phosphoribosyl 1,2-cyclic phosphodiesterase
MTAETILVVDDDRLILHICQDVLGAAGFKTVCLESGATLAETVASVSPDLIVLDIMMPGTDGLTLCRKLRSGQDPFRGPIIVFSAKAYRADRELASEVGANAFLEKPFDPEHLVALIREFLTGKISVRFWGVRGSIPTASRETVGYGGNTPCIELQVAGIESTLIWDGGTGLRELGRNIRRRGKTVRGYLCFSHFHWDHIQGLPFFEPAYTAGNEFTLVGPSQPTADLMQILSGQMASVYFPVGLEQFGARMMFDEIGEGTTMLGGVQFDTLSSFHPGRALMYRLVHGSKRVIYATDNELPPNWKTAGGSAAHEVERFLTFFAGADLLIHDAQYTPEELENRRGWGHSAWTDVVDLALLAQVKRVILFHHDPDHSDAFLDDVRAAVQQRVASAGAPLACDLAREGDCVVL